MVLTLHHFPPTCAFLRFMPYLTSKTVRFSRSGTMSYAVRYTDPVITRS